MKRLNLQRLPNGVSWRQKTIAKKAVNAINVFLSIVFISGCSGKNNSYANVTYRVSVNSGLPHEVFIAYKDSAGYVTLYTEEDWSIEVRLPHRHVASLLVVSQQHMDIDNQNVYSICECKPEISAQIIHGKNIVSDSSEDVISMSVITSAL